MKNEAKATETGAAKQPRPVCEIPDCESPASYRGTCSPEHYQERALRHQAALRGFKPEDSSEEARSAILVEDNLPGMHGHAALYKVTPPMPASRFDDEPGFSYEYVVCSAVDPAPEGGDAKCHLTYLFGANEAGELVDYRELLGSLSGSLDHVEAFARAGYEVVGGES